MILIIRFTCLFRGSVEGSMLIGHMFIFYICKGDLGIRHIHLVTLLLSRSYVACCVSICESLWVCWVKVEFVGLKYLRG